MRLAFLFYLAAGAALASTPATLGPSSQNFVLTGIGANALQEGQSKVSWGNCAFDGKNTNCTLSGTYSGFDGGGTYSFVLSYPGTGAFPLIAVSVTAGSNQFTFQAQSAYSLVITLNTSTGGRISFYSFANFTFLYDASAVCTGVSVCGVSSVGLAPNATISGAITGTFDPTPFIEPGGAVTATAYGAFAAASPASWIEIYGINLGTTLGRAWALADFNGINAPTALAGTTVTIAGQNAYVYYVSPGQVDVQVPSNIGPGPQPLVLTTAGGSATYTLQINALEPGLLAPTAFIINGHQYIGAQFAGTPTFVLPVSVGGIVTARAKAGDILTLYGIGFGPVSPGIPAGQIVQGLNSISANMQISFGGVPATISYAGLAPGFVGLYQFNVTVPNIAASDTVPVTFSLAGTPGPQNLVISIK